MTRDPRQRLPLSVDSRQPALPWQIDEARSAEQIEQVRALMREYALTLAVDLCFQNFEHELATLPGEYAAPQGLLLLAQVDGEPAGCGALRPLPDTDYADACEMKRVYVPARHRGLGLGRALAERLIDAARAAGYQNMLLDTLDDMQAARGLYASFGFVEIPPYYYNPIAGAHYLRLEL
jgi:ribosomal protein S18 acetylase RimI-like enzyme